jgi:hypothetical protein
VAEIICQGAPSTPGGFIRHGGRLQIGRVGDINSLRRATSYRYAWAASSESADIPLSKAKVLHSEWEAEVDNRFAVLSAKQRGEGHDLTRREVRALAGEWYRWFVGQHEENPEEDSRSRDLSEALWHLLESVAVDHHETREIDFEAPEVRQEIHPKLADEAETAQFLASKGEVLTPTQ